MDKTLVVIDMQDTFLRGTGEQQLIPVVCQLIRHAKENGWGIILIEFEHCGAIDEAIIRAVGGYPDQTLVIKSSCNGGPEVVACLNEIKIWPLDLLVCGVWGDQCVPDTVSGILEESDLIKIGVIVDAVYPEYVSLQSDDFEALENGYHCPQPNGVEVPVTMKELGVEVTKVIA